MEEEEKASEERFAEAKKNRKHDTPSPSKAIGVPQAASHSDVFDRERALEIVDGDGELLKELAEIFLRNIPEQMASLRAEIESSNAQGVMQIAHKIKGSLGNLAAKRAMEAALRLEMMGRVKSLAGADDAMAKLESDIRQLEEVLRALLVAE